MRLFRRLVPIAFALRILFAQHVGEPTDSLDKVSVDELFRVQVTSVGRKAQQLSKAPAAIFVLTAEDIRRSGATCIPEALRWVPGLTVQFIDGRSWVVSARGGARLYADKMLVMIDGRSVYTPLFSGVLWDALDVRIGDIERIEVVRGPGAVMWGPNAVNGVINIITKRAQQTKGAEASIAAGNELRGSTDVRWGASPNDKIAYRVWGKFDYRTPAIGSTGLFLLYNRDPYPARIDNLDAAASRAGFRMDWQTSDRDQFMAQADAAITEQQDPVAYGILLPTIAERAQGHRSYQSGSVHSRWTHTKSESNESVLQFSFDRLVMGYPFLSGDLNNMMVDFQKRRQLGEFHELYWGAGYQQYWDATESTRFIAFTPPSASYRSGDVVVRDEWQLVPGKWLISGGVRLDYNSFRRLEYQPSVRLLFTPQGRQSAWLAFSRAVRIPSRLDTALSYNGGSLTQFGLTFAIPSYGSPQMRSETERSLEMGYRFQSGQRWSLDTSVFWSYYGRLRTLEGAMMPELRFVGQTPMLELPTYYRNGGAGRSYGSETWAMVQVSPAWRLIPSYSYLNESRWLSGTPYYTMLWDHLLGDVPHQAALRSQHSLSRNVQFDVMARARSRSIESSLPGAFLLDGRLGWRILRSGELSLAVQNVTNRRILESLPEAANAAIPLRRTVVLRWTQRL